jgi:hypothetical protein
VWRFSWLGCRDTTARETLNSLAVQNDCIFTLKDSFQIDLGGKYTRLSRSYDSWNLVFNKSRMPVGQSTHSEPMRSLALSCETNLVSLPSALEHADEE